MFTDISALAQTLLPTHLGANVWIGDKQIREVLSLEISQKHGAHNTMVLRFYQDQVQEEGAMLFDGAERLLGQVAEVIIFDKNGTDGDRRLENLFVVTGISFDQSAMNEGIIILKAQSPTFLLDGAAHYESFYNQSLAGIARTLCKPLERFKSSLKADLPAVKNTGYICRYGESSWNFLKRLGSATGQWLYFNGKELVFGRPEPAEGRDLVYGQNCYQIAMDMQSAPVLSGYFDYEASQDEPLYSEANKETDVSDSDRGFVFGKAKEMFAEDSRIPPPAFAADRDWLNNISKGKANSIAADMYLVSGESTLHELRVGMIAQLKMVRNGIVLNHTPIRIIDITHKLDVTGHYTNSFKAISAQSLAPPEMDFIKPQAQAMPAIVMDNKDPLDQGRVKVSFIGWKQEHSAQLTDWIRVLTPDAGSSDTISKNRGYVFVPELGDQVMVGFEHNNPDRPFIQGSLFHGKNGIGGGIENNVKSIITRSGHTVELNDGEEGTHIVIKDPGGNEIFLDTRGKNIMITAPETISLKAKNIVMEATERIQSIAGEQINAKAKSLITTDVTEGSMVNTVKKDISQASEHYMIKANSKISAEANEIGMVAKSEVGIDGGSKASLTSKNTEVKGSSNTLKLP